MLQIIYWPGFRIRKELKVGYGSEPCPSGPESGSTTLLWCSSSPGCRGSHSAGPHRTQKASSFCKPAGINHWGTKLGLLFIHAKTTHFSSSKICWVPVRLTGKLPGLTLIAKRKQEVLYFFACKSFRERYHQRKTDFFVSMLQSWARMRVLNLRIRNRIQSFWKRWIRIRIRKVPKYESYLAFGKGYYLARS